MSERDPVECFAKSYTEARTAFLIACAQNGAEIVSHRHATSSITPRRCR